MGYERLQAKKLAEIREDEAELFARELVIHELTSRHVLGWTLEGPPPPNVGGTDLRVRLAHAPRVTRAAYAGLHRCEPLTFDEVGVDVVFSVKSGETGKQHALEEAKKGAPWAAEALANGGRLVIVLMIPKDDAPKRPPKDPKTPAKGMKKKVAAAPTVSTPTAKETFTQKLCALYRTRVRTGDPQSADPAGRIHIVDCNDLLTYLQGVRPALSRRSLEALGIAPIPGLLDLDGWDADHRRDRAPTPAYVWDDERTTNATQIVNALKETTAAPRALWLLSPPGVGKTRLVLEALRRDDPDAALRARVRAATDPAIAERAMTDHELFDRYADAVLIVDDCREDDVFRLERIFHQQARDPAARLMLITPMAPAGRTAQAPPTLDALELGPLGNDAVRALIAREAGLTLDDARVVEIARQTGGYPWFAVLVMQTIRPLDDPPHVRSLAQAVDFALAPVSPDHPAVVARHGAALMAVMLVSEDIEGLSPTEKQSVLALFDDVFADWASLYAAIRACKQRGLVRTGEGGIIRYVTPAILELEIARRFMGPDPGGGPQGRIGPDHPLRPRLDRLLERLRTLGFETEQLATLATPILAKLSREPAGIVAFDRITRAELEFASESSPAAVAREMRRHIEATALEDLKLDTDRRRSIMFALGAVASRRGTFDDAEAALFRLASAENESYANNATRTWAGLFDLELNQTYEPPERRLQLLEARLDQGDATARSLVLVAIERILSRHGFKLAAEPRDAAFPRPTIGDVHLSRERAWSLLGRILAGSDPLLKHEGAALAARELRSAVRSGVLVAAVAAVATSLDGLSDVGLRELRTAVETVQAHERPWIEKGRETREAWERLVTALEPKTYGERLRQQLGSWSRVVSPSDEEVHDRELAREALERPDDLRRELSWLESSDALRGVHFLVVLGDEDRDAFFLSDLVARAASAPGLVSGYLAGHEKAGRSSLVQATLQDLRGDRALAGAVADAIWRLPASAERVAWLCEDLRAGRFDDRVIAGFASGHFIHSLDGQELIAFVEALLETSLPAGAIVAVRAVALRLEKAAPSPPADCDVLLRLLERALIAAVAGELPEGHHGYIWNEGAKALLKARASGEVVERLLSMIVHASDVLPRPEVVEVLHIAVGHSPLLVWERLRPRLESSAAARTLAAAAREAGLVENLPGETLLAWAGHDEERGVTLARMVDMHDGASSAALARELVARFGDQSHPAGVLASDLHTTPRAFESLARFANETLKRMASWEDDPRPNVRRFTERLLQELAGSRDFYTAREARERRRLGS
ncbi:MAG: hypothetical protein U0270_27280 [Labilithrix sp.]